MGQRQSGDGNITGKHREQWCPRGHPSPTAIERIDERIETNAFEI